MSGKLNGHSLRLQIDTASDITLISQRLRKTIGQPPLTPTRHVAQRVSGDCVHITRELPATTKIENKTASRKIYIADSRHNLLSLDFVESLGLLDIPLYSVCNAVSRSSSPLRSRPMTPSSVFPQSSHMTVDTALNLKLQQLHLFSDRNDQSSSGLGYM